MYLFSYNFYKITQSRLFIGKYFFHFYTRIEDVVKRVHKTMITIQTLHNDIVGLLYDIKEFLTNISWKFNSIMCRNSCSSF